MHSIYLHCPFLLLFNNIILCYFLLILCGICRLLIVDLIADSYFVVYSICLLHDVVINLQLFDSPFSFHCILLAKHCSGSYFRGRILLGICSEPQLPRSRSYLQQASKLYPWQMNVMTSKPRDCSANHGMLRITHVGIASCT
jgi:hypothetical protein